MTERHIQVTSRKYDGSRHWDFDSVYLREEGPLLVTSNYAGQELTNPTGGWTSPWDIINNFWSDRWYNVIQCNKTDGTLDHFYCNVTTPANYDGDAVTYIDLDLDLSVSAGGELEILDEDEFLENSKLMGYPPDVIRESRAALDELVRLASAAEGPFELLRTVKRASS